MLLAWCCEKSSAQSALIEKARALPIAYTQCYLTLSCNILHHFAFQKANDALEYHNVTTEHLSHVSISICSGPFMACLETLASYNLNTNLAKSDMLSLLHGLCLSQAQSSSCNSQQARVSAEPSCTARGTSCGTTGSGS